MIYFQLFRIKQFLRRKHFRQPIVSCLNFVFLCTMDEKLKLILNQSIGVFMRYGIKSVTMDDLARELAVSKKTLYQYVKDKNELLIKSIELLIDDDCTMCVQLREHNFNAVEEMLHIYTQGTDKLKNFHPSVIYDLQKYYPEAWAKFDHHRKTFITQEVFDNIEKGKAEGLYRQEIDSKLVSIFYSMFIHSLIEPSMKYLDGEYTLQKLILEHVLYHLHAVCTDKGKKQINKYFNNN